MKSIRILVFVLLTGVLSTPALRAHCDTLDGPVVKAAQLALARGDIAPALMWVRQADETELRTAFARTLRVRALSEDAATVADRWFFETLVRLHRAGEGAPFMGLQPEGAREPGIAEADAALSSGNLDPLVATTVQPLKTQLAAKFERVKELERHATRSTAAGRAYVQAYVEYVHFAERLAELAAHAETATEPPAAAAHASAEHQH